MKKKLKKIKNFLYTCARPLLLLLQYPSNNNVSTAADIMKYFLKPFEMQQTSKLFESSIEKQIVLNIKNFKTYLTKNSSTKKHKSVQDKIDLIVHASVFNNDDEKSKVCDFLALITIFPM